MSLVPHITDIEYKVDEDLLILTFSNNVTRKIYAPTLRGFCPCAHCQGHGGGPHRWVPIMANICKKIENIAPVGTYAASIVWEDGHDTGIYTYKNLLAWPTIEQLTPEMTDLINEGDSLADVMLHIT